MASLALGAAGAFIGGFFGGPIGASIGWSLGSALGSSLDPKKIEGPRLSDLKLQTSSYGKEIPIVYGTKRASGNVIWQTDLNEVSSTTGGKGGGPEVTTYTYTASFSVLLCEGPIENITRVWADGRLVLDRTPGAPVSAFPFVTYYGTETQEADPTMEASLGVGNVPAHRGLAYVVFDEIDLNGYGNRIPNLEFEVVTLAHTDAAMSIVRQVIGPIHFRAGNTPYGDRPVILSWPHDEDARVRIKASTSVYEYGFDLVYIETVAATINDYVPAVLSIPASGGGTHKYVPIGSWITGGVPTDVHAIQYTSIGNVSDPGLIGIGNHGIPGDEFVGGGCLTEDRLGMFIFTGPSRTDTGASIINKWYLLENGSILKSGTISPALSYILLAIGNGCGTGGYPYGAMSAENGRRALWMHHGAGSDKGGFASVYYIDDAGNMASNATVGSANVNGDTDDIFAYPSCSAFEDGYCGVVTGKTLTIFTRFPIGESLKVPVADIIADISERSGLTSGDIDVTDVVSSLTGYSLAQQMTARAALEPLQAAYFFDPVESDGKIKFVERADTVAVTIDDDDLAAYVGDAPPSILSTQRQQEIELPRVVDVVYINADADYQEGNQSAIRNGTLSKTAIALSLPIAMFEIEAKAIADRTLYISWSEREKFKFNTARKFARYEPTDVLFVHGRNVRITEKVEHPSGLIEWSGVAAVAGATFIQGSVPGSGSGFVEQTPPSIQGTTLRLLDIPLLSDNDSKYGFYVAMAGAIDTNWRGGSLYKSIDGGVNYTSIAAATVASRIGTCTTTLGNFVSGNIFDETNTVTVELTAGSEQLTSSNELGVLNGANLCLIGSEILQYKTATLTTTRTYVLSGLLRGRFGTDWAVSAHVASESFTAFPASLAVSGQQSEIGLARLYKAVTSGQSLAGAVAQSFTNAGYATMPYSPCNLGGGRDASGNITLNWIRRNRIAGGWVDYIDVPMSEDVEQYNLTIYSSGTYATVKRQVTVTSPTYTYTAADQTTDFGGTQSTLYWDVGQLGGTLFSVRRAVT